MDTFDLGLKIKSYRLNSGKSQLLVELETQLSPGVMSRIENGLTNPNKETILRIAQVLNLNGVETASLFGIDIKRWLTEFRPSSISSQNAI